VLQLQASGSVSNDGMHLADLIWNTLEKHFVYRVVLDMGQVEMLSDYVLQELIALSHRLRTREGMLKLYGLSATNRRILQRACLDGRLPTYATRREAVFSASAATRTDKVCLPTIG
jgi:anti-anti-sigma regulatory factor